MAEFAAVGQLTFSAVFAVMEGYNTAGPCHRLYGLADGKLYRYVSFDNGLTGWIKFNHTELEEVVSG
jgi:hypothetical protein